MHWVVSCLSGPLMLLAWPQLVVAHEQVARLSSSSQTAEQRAKLELSALCIKAWQPSGKASPTSFQGRTQRFHSQACSTGAKLSVVARWSVSGGATFYDPNPAKVAYRQEILCPVCGKSIFVEGEPSERG